jgi:hypothetical protein
MTENKNLSLLKFALGYFAITTIVYGIGLLFFTGLALLYQLVFDWQPDYNVMFTAAPCAINLVGSALLWLGRAKAR